MTHTGPILPAPPSYRRLCASCGSVYVYYPDDPGPCPWCGAHE